MNNSTLPFGAKSPRKGLNKKNNRGFTLTEVITAVVVLGILAGVGVALIGNAADTARENAGKANAETLNSATANLVAAGATFKEGSSYGQPGDNHVPARRSRQQPSRGTH